MTQPNDRSAGGTPDSTPPRGQAYQFGTWRTVAQNQARVVAQPAKRKGGG